MKIPICTALSNVCKRVGPLKVVVCLAEFEPITGQGFESTLLEVFGAGTDSGEPAAWKRWQPDTFANQGEEQVKKKEEQVDISAVAKEYAKLAKALGLIDSGNSILESAIPLKNYLLKAKHRDLISGWKSARTSPIELDAVGGVSEKALFWQVLISSDILLCTFAHLLAQQTEPIFNPNDQFKDTVATKGVSASAPARSKASQKKLLEVEHNLMTDSYEIIRCGFNDALWSDVENLDEIRNYCERMKRWSSFRHHAPPRIEWLVDLGLLEPQQATEGTEDRTGTRVFRILEACRRAGAFFEKHLFPTFDVQRFLHDRLFTFLNETYGLEAEPAKSSVQVFKYLARGYSYVARDLGDTPIRSAATLGSIFALEDRVLIDLPRMYEVGAKPPAEFAGSVDFSGGSRLDDEFLFSIRPKALKAIIES